MHPNMYILVRRDLPPSQQAVQAGHALAEYMLDHEDYIGIEKDQWLNGTLVYLGVDNEEDILMWLQRLADRDIPFSCFEEPDMDMQVTAIAALDCPKRELKKLFSRLNLL